jgi:Flp pilus assembly protein TadB
MDDELPQLLDLLAAASHAGLGGPLALRRAVDGIRGPLADELAWFSPRSISAAGGARSSDRRRIGSSCRTCSGP